MTLLSAIWTWWMLVNVRDVESSTLAVLYLISGRQSSGGSGKHYTIRTPLKKVSVTKMTICNCL